MRAAVEVDEPRAEAGGEGAGGEVVVADVGVYGQSAGVGTFKDSSTLTYQCLSDTVVKGNILDITIPLLR